MKKTEQDLKEALKCHSMYPENCNRCPYRKISKDYCSKVLAADAFSTIDQLSEKVREKIHGR